MHALGEAATDALTVCDLDAHGADAVSATCEKCGRTWPAMVRFLPPATPLTKVAALLECRACGGQRVSVEPIWRHGPPAVN